MKRKKVLILCTGNSARSQMAEGLLKHITQSKYEIFSAGTKPNFVRPEAIKVLAEIGVDIMQNRSKSINEFTEQKIDYVLTVCDDARESCPYFPAEAKLIHHSFEDPASVKGDEQTVISAFRRVRVEIQSYLENEFVKILDENKSTKII